MATPKAKTLQERFGFADPDLKNPKHDEMIKWIDANIEDILMVLFSLTNRPKNVQTRWEPVVRQEENKGQFIGFVDFMARYVYEVKGEPMELRVLFEAKTVMPSLGELFRQVGLYREGYIDGSRVWGMKFVIVCPDETEAETIKQQRLHFLKFDPMTKFSIGGV